VTPPSSGALVRQLREKAARFPNARGATLGLRIFLRQLPSQRRPELEGVRWHGLEELYAT